MKQYKIFQHPSGVTEAVKQGWSWPAFFFSGIWAMVKKQWALGIGVLVGFFALGFFVALSFDNSSTGEGFINLAAVICNIIFGVQGNSWRENNLMSRGYEFKDTVSAANPEGALALFMKAKPVVA